MIRSQTTPTLRTLAVLLALAVAAAALSMAFAGDAQAKKKNKSHKKRPPVSVPAPPNFIAFTSARDGNYEIYKMNEDGSNQQNLTNIAASDAQPVVSDSQAAVSPDGTKIAFVSDREGDAEIYVMNSDGSNQQNLTKNEVEDQMPTWSPDGKQIAFMSRRDGNPEIYKMDSDTGANQTNLTNNPARDMAPDWSPDGISIAFETNRDGNAEIYFMGTDGQLPYNLSRNPAGDFGVNWAPDPYIDYANKGFTRAVANDDGSFNYEIYEMTYLGVTQTNLTNSPATETDPAYSPDGTKIAFGTDRDGNEDIYKMNRDGSSAVQLTTDTASDFDPDWSKASSQ